MEQPNFWFWTSTLTPENTIQQYWPSSWFSSNFAHILSQFHLEMLFFPYLEMYTRPWEQYPPTSSLSFSTILSYFIAIFYLTKAMPSIFGNGQWILRTVGPYSPRKASTNKRKCLLIVKKITCFFFETRTPDTSSSPRKSIQNWNVFSCETMKYISFRVLATRRFI